MRRSAVFGLAAADVIRRVVDQSGGARFRTAGLQ